MQARRQLGEFLRSRRSRLSPEEVGVATYDDRRRVPGLRREELALLAGVSRTLLTGADGLQNPTSVAVRGHTVLVAAPPT
ncbi:hypothetical protein [Micromonospora sp. WMMD708]|uniref:hypothetical protein n=1 Tax=Micromonospora sp. WMMD708 TaxID=3403464 RepID=UPI003BF5CEDB